MDGVKEEASESHGKNIGLLKLAHCNSRLNPLPSLQALSLFISCASRMQGGVSREREGLPKTTEHSACV